MLTEAKKEYFRKILQEKSDGLLSRKTLASNNKKIHIEILPDPMDRAASESERNCSLLLMVREKEIIFQISSTLQRLESGSYGICEECGEDISEARLEALPETRLCVDCKRKEELNCAVTDLAASSRVIH